MPELSFGGIINFLFGVAFGFTIFSLLYVYFIVRGKAVSLKDDEEAVESVDQEQLKALITDKQNSFKRMYKKTNKGFGKVLFDLSYELVDEISSYYYPRSKYPMLELSVDEMLMLNNYITNRIDGILEQPVLKNTRNVRISGMVHLYQRKKNIEDTKLLKAVRNKKLNKAFRMTLGAINVMNPAYWVRKLVIGTSVDFMTRRIAYTVIGVVGEETSKVYSKKLFDKDIDFDIVDKELRTLEEGVDDEEDSDET